MELIEWVVRDDINFEVEANPLHVMTWSGTSNEEDQMEKTNKLNKKQHQQQQQQRMDGSIGIEDWAERVPAHMFIINTST